MKNNKSNIMQFIEEHKLISYIAIGIIAFIVIFVAIYLIRMGIEKNTDTTNAIHGIIKNNLSEVKFSYWKDVNLRAGTNVYILDEVYKGDVKYYKIKYNNRIGRVLAENVDYFTFDTTSEHALMSDVSKFNYKSQFNSSEEYELFLLKNDINYVYIRIGGRGYGQAGNFYTDPNNQVFIDACEYLGVPYGFYYIDEALNDLEINEEIDFVKDFLANNSTSMCKLPLVIDLEYFDGAGRSDNSWDGRAELIKKLQAKFRESNIYTLVYTSYLRANYYLYDVDTKFWVAYYPKDNKFPENWFFDYLNLRTKRDNIKTFKDLEKKENESVKFNITSYEFKDKIIGWQFSENGAKENGINEEVDLSVVKNKEFINLLNN